MLLKTITGLLLILANVTAAPAQELSQYLMGVNGKKTLFVKADETTLPPADKAASERARLLSRTATHAGEVYYRKGVKIPANRYISTGRILVRFAQESPVDPKAFAEANGLVFVRSFGQAGSSVVFVNKSDSDDLTRANALLQDAGVSAATPDWVLPVKLY